MNTKLLPADIHRILSIIIDPEIGINIVDLGLIYAVDVNVEGNVYILLTFTSPACPFADEIMGQITDLLENIEGVKNVDIDITFQPAWSQNMMSEAALLESGLL